MFRRRQKTDACEYEIAAGDEWTASNPAAINRWFEEQVRERSPNEDGGYQLRRMFGSSSTLPKLTPTGPAGSFRRASW